MGADGVTPLAFATDGGAPWSADPTTYYAGGGSAKSGAIGGAMFSYLTTTVSGPASVSFYQKVSSEPTYDGLSFYIDTSTTPKYKTTGEVNWQQKAFTLPAGTHTLRWKYAKNAATSRGSDAAWLDKVVVSPHTALAITYPNGGENLDAGATATITWNAPAAAEKYDLYYTTNNGMTWKLITSGYASPDFTNATYSAWSWPVPKGNASACKVKVVAKNGAGRVVGSDVSNKPFTIQTLKVTSPNGGESLGAQTTPTIAFTIYGQQNAASATISYTMNNGASWPAITTLTGALTPGGYTCSWNVPAVATLKSACKVKVVLKSATGAVLGSDVSDLAFAIQPLLALSGVVTLNGQAFSGVTMSLTGDGTGTATTDVYGKYSFTKLVNGNYTIRPSRFGYSFTPSSATRTISGTSITGVNFTATPGDTTPPSVPTGLRVTVATPQSTTANISWTASTDNSLLWGYKIYRNGNYLKSVSGTSTADAGLALNAGYCYAVSAYDLVGNESAQCAPMCVDRVPPTVPEILSANPVYPSQVDLSWTAATDIGTGVEGYKLYRDGVLVKSPIIETAGSNGGLMQGTSYCFTVTAFDKALNESAQSSSVCPTTPSWQYEFITKSTTTESPQSMNNGDYSEIAIDGAGHLHAIYENDNTWPYPSYQYATNGSGSWAATTLVPNITWPGVASSIATDTNGKVHISYYASNTYALYYMTNSLGSWTTTSIDGGIAGVNTGGGNSLAVDKNNKVHVSYCEGNGAKLKYATNASGSWVTTLIDTDTNWQGIRGSSIALDSLGNVHIGYVGGTFNSSSSVKYATNAAGAWVTTIIDEDANAGSTSIGIDLQDKIHVAYQHEYYGTLHYAANASGQWESYTIDHPSNNVAAGGSPALKIDMNDKVHIVYQEQDNYNTPHYRTLKHATNASGEWIAVYVVEPADPLNLGYSNSLVIDQNNKLHIGTYDAVNLGLRHEYY